MDNYVFHLPYPHKYFYDQGFLKSKNNSKGNNYFVECTDFSPLDCIQFVHDFLWRFQRILGCAYRMNLKITGSVKQLNIFVNLLFEKFSKTFILSVKAFLIDISHLRCC